MFSIGPQPRSEKFRAPGPPQAAEAADHKGAVAVLDRLCPPLRHGKVGTHYRRAARSTVSLHYYFLVQQSFCLSSSVLAVIILPRLLPSPPRPHFVSGVNLYNFAMGRYGLGEPSIGTFVILFGAWLNRDNV